MNHLAAIAATAIITSAAHSLINAAASQSQSLPESGQSTLPGAPAQAPGSCDTTCPFIAQVECEPCGVDLAAGCAIGGPKSQVLQIGDTICGTFWADSGTRDTDFFRFTTLGGTVTLNVQSNIPAVCFILDNNCPPSIIATGVGDCPNGLSASATLEGGDYQLFIATEVFDGYPCDETTIYTAALTADAPPAPCPADLSRNGSVEVADLLILINAWGPCE